MDADMKKNSGGGEENIALGKHLTLEYYECDPAILADGKRMEELFVAAAKAAGATVLGSNFHEFTPQGVSGFVIIAESHFSVHAWPEHEYAAVDIFTCGDSIDFQIAMDSLKEGMRAGELVISGVMNRGIIGNNGVEQLVPLFEDASHSYALSWRRRFSESRSRGISVNVDIYHPDRSRMGSAIQIGRLVGAAMLKMNVEGPDEFQCREEVRADGEKFFNLSQSLADGGISGQFMPDAERIYLYLYSRNYFEPRSFAEIMLESFGGKYYRMQPYLRR